MNLKTFGKCVWLVLAVVTLSAAGWAKRPSKNGYEVRVSVFNDAQISEGRVARAERVAHELFAHAGIHIDWMNCGRAAEATEERVKCNEAAFPAHLEVRLLERSLNLSESTLGLSYLGEDGVGCHADLFYVGIVSIEQEGHLNAETILGLAMAHEIGHLLLGSNSHSSSGIMRAKWQRQELFAAGKGTLGFSEAEARKMQNRLERVAVPGGPSGLSRSR